METTEFRTGNKVMFGERVINISHHDIANMAKMEKIEGEILIYKPIPLTEDWLVRFGFNCTHEKNCYQIWFSKFSEHRIYITLSKTGNILTLGDSYSLSKEHLMVFTNIGIEYVHQLQNLYFALTRTELELKSKN